MTSSPRTLSGGQAAIVLFLFSLPFVVVGIGVGTFILSNFAGQRPSPGVVLAGWSFACGFAAFGLFLLFLALASLLFPDNAVGKIKFKGLEDEWKERRVSYGAAAAAIGWLVGAGVSAVMVTPTVILALRQASYLWLLTILAPVAALVQSARAYVRIRKFGTATCTFAEPGRPGEVFRLTIRTAKPVEAQKDFEFTLRCEERTLVRGDENTHLQKTTVWSDRQGVDFRSCRSNVGVAVAFALPADARHSSRADAREGTFWVLECSAPTPGVDFYATFVLPVVRAEAGMRDER